MDNLTHTLTGLMMARVGLGRTTERGGSLMLMLAANAPDMDALFGLPGSTAYIEYHRGFLHSLTCAPLLAVLPLLVSRWVRGAAITWQTYLACVLGVLSHLALDFTNVYGIRLLLPFSSRWLHLDITDVVDPWIWLILLLALAAPSLSDLVSSAISGRTSLGPRRGWAWFALIVLLSYDGFRFAAHQRAIAVMSAYNYGGDDAPHIYAMPEGPRLLANPLEWRGVIETSDEVLNVPVSLTGDFDPGRGEVDYPAPDSPAIEAVKKTHPFQVFLNFNQLPFWKVTPVEEGTLVQLIDLRFGTPRQGSFATVSAVVAPDGSVRGAGFGRSR